MLGAGYFAYGWLFPSDERLIRAALNDLAATVSQSGGEGLAQMARAAKLGQLFTEDVVVQLGPGFAPIRGRDTIMALAAKAQVPGEGFTVRFVDVTVAVDASGLAATADLTATVQGRSLGDLQAIDAKELEIAFRKVGQDWLIERVTGVNAIERPR